MTWDLIEFGQEVTCPECTDKNKIMNKIKLSQKFTWEITTSGSHDNMKHFSLMNMLMEEIEILPDASFEEAENISWMYLEEKGVPSWVEEETSLGLKLIKAEETK